MPIKYSYQGKEASRDKNESTYKQTLYGSEQQVNAHIGGLIIGNYAPGKGFLKSWHKTQMDPYNWQVEVQYSETFDFQFSDDAEQVIGKKSAQMSTRQLQMPLEKCKNYLAVWNHFLFSNNGIAPVWVTQRKDLELTTEQRKHYRWGTSLSDMPQIQGEDWGVAAEPWKPGYDYYDLSYFVVTISAKYNSARDAGNAISKNINKITTPLEDFGLGGSWKYDEANVSYDGRNWIATQVYTRAVDEWDSEIYQSASGSSTNSSSN